ncbi:PASTA domain-containing protein [Spirillospora sp. CA-294931]|uniref:PASTA domain-containing protein n=1 Tax=Spirillospora sp. CA-294931 TaxID=3240042 RepID=UPI003D9270E2
MPVRQALAGEMTRRSTVLLAGVGSVLAAAVLGLTLLVGGGTGAAGRGSDAEAGTTAFPGGPASVPRLAGLPSMTAAARLAAARVPLGTIIRVPSSRPAGLVVRTYPAAGTPVRAGDRVTLYVSAGRGGSVTGGRVPVPYLAGVTEAQARGAASALGLRIVVRKPGAVVTSQDPAPGTVLPRGSAITLGLR